MASRGLAKVAISVTTLDRAIARKMEPRAATPPRRLEAIKTLSAAGVPVVVMVAPIVPAINDSEIERILAAAREAGASEAGYVLLRLPLEIKELFREWLQTEFPNRAAHAINILRSMHGGKDYTPEWGVRQRGRGPYAEQIALAVPPGREAPGAERAHLEAAHRPLPAPGRRPAASSACFDSGGR